MHLKIFLTIILLVQNVISLKLLKSRSEQKSENATATNDHLNDIEESVETLSKDLRAATTQIHSILRTIQTTSLSKPLPRNCKEVQALGYNDSGIYSIQPQFSEDPFLVSCDMDSQGGGWTVFLNRFNGDQDFYKNWTEYKTGFGNLATEFWLGLERLYLLTGFEVNELLVELEDWEGKEVYAHYDAFAIGNEKEGYVMKLLGGYRGTAGDSLKSHAAMKFTTWDVDQDKFNAGNCASYRGGAWWYKSCVESHLTGKYLKGTVSRDNEYKGMLWTKFHGGAYSLKEARMMVRPK